MPVALVIDDGALIDSVRQCLEVSGRSFKLSGLSPFTCTCVEQILTTCRQAQLATESQKLNPFSRSLYTSSKALDTPVSADHGKVSTAEEGDIGRGTHQAAPVEDGDPPDVVPNLVTPEDTSG